MNYKNIIQEDLDSLIESYNFDFFDNQTFFITGATGLIGFSIIMALLKLNNNTAKKIKIYALVRDVEKAKNLYYGFDNDINFIASDIRTVNLNNYKFDYIIHAASQTSSQKFVLEPVETIEIAIKGTVNLLEYSKTHEVKGFIYLSSMEVYGNPTSDDKVFEDSSTTLNTMNVRSSYPESKRMCENLCKSYAYEYGVPAKVIRLTQTFGPGVKYNDKRVFAEFARCAIENKNIILKTKGETKRSYLYTFDAVAAIFIILEKGKIGEAYNAANESTYCSIFDMANLVSKKISNNKIKIIIDENDDISKFGYANTLKINLETNKLRSLGWSAKYCLEDMFIRMIEDMQNSKIIQGNESN